MFLSKVKAALVAALVWRLLAVGSVVLAEDHHKKAHPNDPVKQEEHSALFELVDDRDATHVAVASGDWGDVKTWNKKAVPGAGARVIIPKDRTVRVAAMHDRERLDW